MRHTPKRPVPAPLRGADKASFAEDTIIRRMPAIAQRVLTENQLEATAAAKIQTLIDEIPEGRIRSLTDHHAPDFDLWNQAISLHTDQNWLETAWFFAETYFYRRIIEAVDYFGTGFDPFAYQKTAGLKVSLPQTELLCQQLATLETDGWQKHGFIQLLTADLWGNQVDLSLWTADSSDKPDHQDNTAQRAHTIVDDSLLAFQHLDQTNNAEIDFIIDNAGFELIGDLVLADYLLTVGKAATVHFHLKLHPTFVSDATATDIAKTLDFLTAQAENTVRGLGERMKGYLENGRFQHSNHPFWTSPHPLWLLPDDLRQTLASATLIISKGDANYRRSIGDAHWPYTTLFADVVSTMPAPFLTLRTCKSDVIVGLEEGKAAELNGRDPNWIINGKWGLIQYVSII